MDASTAKLLVDTFFQPDCDIPEMVKSQTKMYLSLLLYQRTRWHMISGWRFWGHQEVFNLVTKGLDNLGVKYKTDLKRGCWHIYVYSKQTKKVNIMAHKAIDEWCEKNPRHAGYYRPTMKALIK